MAIFDVTKKILLDSDVIIHFIKGGQLLILHKIFPNKLCILDEVFHEVFKGTLKQQVENLFNYRMVSELKTPTNMNFKLEVAKIQKKYNADLGESICMAYCKFNKDILASSNLSDIKKYCEENGIQYLTTMDFLYEAYNKGLLSEPDFDYFIYNVKSKGSKLPINNLKEYISNLK